MARPLVAIIAVLLLVSSSSPVFASNPVNQKVSYNPAAASRYHAPISEMGLIAVTRSFNTVPTPTQPFTPSSTAQAQSIPTGLTRFINDSSYMPQSETTVAVDPQNPSHVVGGVNDGRWFFCPDLRAADCPSGYTDSVSGFMTSTNGGTSVAKSNDIPGLIESETNLTSHTTGNSFVFSWGDPSVAAAPGGSFYYASLAIDPVTGANGIMIAKSNANLWDSSSSCSTPISSPSTNTCWSAALVFGNMTYTCTSGVCFNVTFEDKDTIAVDNHPSSAYYGDVYVAWDHFYASGASASYVARCTQALSCTMISGGSAPVASGADQFAGFSTVVTSSDGTVYLSWCNFGTASTLGPVFCEMRSSAPGGSALGTVRSILSFMGAGTELAGDSAIQGFATEQFRTSSELTIAVGPNSELYFAIPLCLSGSYYQFQGVNFLPADNPGNCGGAAVFFTRSTDGGATWSTPSQLPGTTGSSSSVAIQPTVTVDPTTGAVVVAFYSSLFDSFNHRIDVVAMLSNDNGQTFSMTRVTQVSNEPDDDPSGFNYFAQFGGSLVVPQYGDYFTAAALGGKVWILFTGNYAQELGTYQTDPFLAVVGETPSALTLGPNSNAASPGERVSYTASGLTQGTNYKLTIDWSGETIVLSNGTVPTSGIASGNFTVPNVESQVYTVVAADSAGLSSSAQMGVGQVSLGPLQSTLTGLQSSLTSIQNSLGTLSSETQAIGTAVAGLGTSLSSVNSSLTSLGQVQNGIGQSLSSVSSDVKSLSSSLTIVEILVGVTIVLVIVAIVMSRGRGGTKSQAAPQMTGAPGST